MTIRAFRTRDKYFICTKCHFIGHGEVIRKGSRFMEWIMWGVFLIPGPFYSLWRFATKYLVCPKCKSKDLLSVDSPQGKALFNDTLRGK